MPRWTNLFAKKRVTSLCRCHKFSLDYLFGWLSASITSFHRTYSLNFLTFLYLLVSNKEELHEFGDIISSEFRSRDHSRFRKRRNSKGPVSYTPFTAVRTNFWSDKIYNCGTRFSRNRANSVTDCSTVCCSTCTISRAPCKLKKDPCKFLSPQKFVRIRVSGVLNCRP